MLYLIVVILVFIGLAIAWLVFNLKNRGDEEGRIAVIMDRLKNLSEQNDKLRETIDEKLEDTHKAAYNIGKESHELMKDVTEKLTRVDETSKQVVNVSAQLQNLQDILKNPKQRGILGEYFLENLLKNVLPVGSYQMQYKLGKDEEGKDLVPDAVVFVRDKIIPIDSKFSLENYNRISETHDESERARLEKIFVNDLRNRIVETSKYVQPSKGTLEFAFMFIPHEAIYYDLLINKVGAIKNEETENFIQRAAAKYKVVIVSPTSFLAYLQTVLQGLKALQIEESAKEIRKKVEDLGRHLGNYEVFMKKLGNNLGTTVNSYNAASKEFKKVDKDIAKISEGESKVEPMILDKPNME